MHPKQNKENTDYVAKETKKILERVYTDIFSTVKIYTCILDLNI